MRFSFLLFIIKTKMGAALVRKQGFREKAAEKDFTIQIMTADSKRGRWFKFEGGKITSSRGIHSSPDVSLVWSDASTGFNVMASGSNKATMAALQDGRLKLEGNGELAMHFTGVVKAMM